ncbi:MAG: LamB/YcsF family protein [Thalassotalea sp.]|nr:LamB/YcsF family protein [Thalassotalea sp.]
MLTLNCDLGELVGEANNDALIMPMIDQANIACGAHAGDTQSMTNTVKLAIQHNVIIGAHPSYPDRENFGRKSIIIEKAALKTSLTAQINALSKICIEQKTQLNYVKPHGALYNDMMKNLPIFQTVCQAVAMANNRLNKKLSLMIQALPNTQPYQKIANKYNITLLFEAFSDRAYQANGLLVPRSQQGAVIHQQEKVIEQITQLIKHQKLTTIDGGFLALHVDSLCVHGDNDVALTLVSSLRKLIKKTNAENK